jgi:hypothetical protein
VRLFSILGPVRGRALRGAGCGLIILAALAVQHSGARAEDLVGDMVLLQGLDKVTARISEINVPLGVAVRFGTLEITAYKCLKRPPEETPESSALLEIRELRVDEGPRVLFRGWMFASSPALNALEHPVYDVWVKDCLNAKSASSNGPK